MRLRKDWQSSLLGCVLSGVLFCQEVRADDPVYRFDIPAESLAEALTDYSRILSRQIIFSEEVVKGITVKGLHGSFTATQALAALLSDTDLVVSTDPAGVLMVRPKSHMPATAAQEPSPTQTDDKAARLEEVLVTAQKKGVERLQDVPVPVAVINADALAATGHVLLRDYYTMVPGLNVSPGIVGRQPLSVRGVTTGGFTTPTVGITIDDVPYGGSTTSGGIQVPDIDPGDLENIEVLRGPQGTLYGSDSMGGLIKYVTKDPSTEGYSGHVEGGTSYVHNGAEPGFDLRASANIPLSDSLAARWSGFTRQDPGYIDNVTTGEKGVNRTEADGSRLTALWQPGESFSLKLSALYERNKSDGLSDVNILPGLGDLQQSYVRGLGGSDTTIQAYSATLRYKVGGVSLTSITGYNSNRFNVALDASSNYPQYLPLAFGVSGGSQHSLYDVKKLSEELRAVVPIGNSFEWLVGGFYTHESVPQDVYIFAEDTSTGAIVGTFFHNNDPIDFIEYAAFTDLTWHITDRFDIQMGGRESRSEYTIEQAVETGPFDQYINHQPSPYIVGPSAARSNSFTYLFTPRLVLSPDVMVYARFASGYRPGIPNTGILVLTVPRQSDPDKTYNYEIGSKADFLDHRLAVDASLYYIDWRNIQISLQSPRFNSYQSNGSRAKSEGAEVSLTARPWRGLNASAWVDYDNAVLTESFPVNSPAYGVPGNRLPNSMRWSSNVSLDQSFPVGRGASGFIGGQVSYVGDRLGVFEGKTSTGAPAARQSFPAYTKTDLRAGVTYESWTFTLYGNNVTDRRALVGGGIGYVPSFGYVYITPRTLGATLSRTF